MNYPEKISVLERRIEALEKKILLIKEPVKFLPIEEFSEGKLRKILHIGRDQIRLLVETGKLQAIKIRRGRKIRLRFTAQAVHEYQERMSSFRPPPQVESAEDIIKRIFV